MQHEQNFLVRDRAQVLLQRLWDDSPYDDEMGPNYIGRAGAEVKSDHFLQHVVPGVVEILIGTRAPYRYPAGRREWNDVSELVAAADFLLEWAAELDLRHSMELHPDETWPRDASGYETHPWEQNEDS